MFRKIMIAILVLLQIAVPVGMATYRPADEDTIREKGTRYVLGAQDGFSCSTTGTASVSSLWYCPYDSDLYEMSGKYAVLSTDEDGFASVTGYTQKKEDGDAYFLRSEADGIGTYFQLDVPPGFADAARKVFRQTYFYKYDEEFTEYEFERTADSPTLGVELFVYRGHAALGELLIDGRTAEEFIAKNQ